ncbi:MAG: DNA-binding response regulator [SAR202 cluster bacterium Ae2-Chloro-G2]|nr:MAG: DNA-binding response regulator [SAR202 cluster bacterium Ae2-Chloro-G2]
MTGEKILVVEDEKNILEAIKYSMNTEGFEVYGAEDGETGLEMAREILPELVILDVMLPKLDGFEVCRILRREMDIPVFMLTAKVEEIDRVVGLEIGADDYITKPFSMRELIARARNVLRRSSKSGLGRDNLSSGKDVIQVGNLKIDLTGHIARISEKLIDLKPREFDLLVMLASSRGRVFTREQILERLWGHDYIGDRRTVDVHIRWIREKIEEDPSTPKKIVTIRGVGYRFDD